MVDKEMLSAISGLMDQKLEEKLVGFKADIKHVVREELDNSVIPRLNSLDADMKYVRVVQFENFVIPRLNTIEGCYLDTSKRYMGSTDKIEEMSMDISNLKSTVKKHSQKLNKISV